MYINNQTLLKQVLGFTIDEYCLELFQNLKNDQKNFLQEYENTLKRFDIYSQEELNITMLQTQNYLEEKTHKIIDQIEIVWKEDFLRDLDIISLGEKRKILQDVIENKEETDFTRLITEFRKAKQEKMANCLKQEFKNILLQKARETEENTEQKLINSRIQECQGKIMKFDQYAKSAEIKQKEIEEYLQNSRKTQ